MQNFKVQTFRDSLSSRDKKSYLIKSKILAVIGWLNKVNGSDGFSSSDLLFLVKDYLGKDGHYFFSDLDEIRLADPNSYKNSEAWRKSLQKHKKTIQRHTRELHLINDEKGCILKSKENPIFWKGKIGTRVFYTYLREDAQQVLKSFFAQKMSNGSNNKCPMAKSVSLYIVDKEIRKVSLSYSKELLNRYSVKSSESNLKTQIATRENRTASFSKNLGEKTFKVTEQAKNKIFSMGINSDHLARLEKELHNPVVKECSLMNLRDLLESIPDKEKQGAFKSFTYELLRNLKDWKTFKKGSWRFEKLLKTFLSENKKELRETIKEKNITKTQKSEIQKEDPQVIEEAQKQVFKAWKEEKENNLDSVERTYMEEIKKTLYENAKEQRNRKFEESKVSKERDRVRFGRTRLIGKKELKPLPLSFFTQGIEEIALLKTLQESRGIEAPHKEKFAINRSDLSELLVSFSFYKEGNAI